METARKCQRIDFIIVKQKLSLKIICQSQIWKSLLRKNTLNSLSPIQMNIVSSVGSVDGKTDSGLKKFYLKYQKHILIVLLREDTVKGPVKRHTDRRVRKNIEIE